MQRIATAIWKGGPRAGEGTFSTATSILNHVPYAVTHSAHNDACTSPCELLAAAHASGVAVALSAELTRAGYIPQKIEAEAVISMEQEGSNWRITGSHVNLRAKVPDIDGSRFQTIADLATDICPISMMLGASMKVTLEAELDSEPIHIHA